MTSFADLQLHPNLLRSLAAEGYEIPTPIQADAIPPMLEGRDILGTAQTGTGKTAAFALPILQHLMAEAKPNSSRAIRTLVLAPTRELAAQIFQSFNSYGRFSGLRYTVIFGGVKQGRQVDALRAGVDVLIATPGRLLDLMNQGYVRLDSIRHLVLDEADNMLDMGFIHDIRKIIAKIPKKRQTLMFSATMPAEIKSLADTILHNPLRVQVAALSAAAENVEHAVVFVERALKPAMLVEYLRTSGVERVLVFTRTKHGADKVAKQLLRSGIRAIAIHGNKSQNARTRAMVEFKSSRPPVLVATDIAARGLDIDEVSHVVNFDLPNVPETYVHRIGRTGRAGASGTAISFCDRDERPYLRDIEKLTRMQIPVQAAPNDLPIIKPIPSAHGPDAVMPRPFHHESHGARPQRPQPRQQQRPAARPQQPHAASLQPRREQTNPTPQVARYSNVKHAIGKGVPRSAAPKPQQQGGASASLAGMSQNTPRPQPSHHPIHGVKQSSEQRPPRQQPQGGFRQNRPSR